MPITADLPCPVVPHPAPARTATPAGAAGRTGAALPGSVAVMSESKRSGPWVVGETHTAFALMGSVVLDLRQAQFESTEVILNATR